MELNGIILLFLPLREMPIGGLNRDIQVFSNKKGKNIEKNKIKTLETM